MAGESPDRSKQRESSEEPTSGSAGPVPEARTEASGPRDPRLAVARAASAGSRGGVDTATRTLSVREAEADAEDAEAEADDREEAAPETEDAGSETAGNEAAGNEAAKADDATGETATSDEAATPDSADDSEDADDPDASDDSDTADSSDPSDSSDASEGEHVGADDGRLRDVVAAWVATADERAAAEADDAEGDASDAREDSDETPEAETADADADAEEADDAPKATAAEPEADADSPEDADDPDDAPEADEPPVDQPTAVFKAPKPAVDQPTTLLKVGDAGAKAPERDAERTSKFVALRNPDDPASRKPPSAAPGAPEAPRAPQTVRTGPTAAVPGAGPERTSQQPLPPKPPLDLLAELTNTPPPPETPLRTTVRRVKIWTPLVVLLAIVFAVVQAARPLPSPTLVLTGKDSYTFDGAKLQLPWPGEGQGWIDADGVGTMGNFGEQKPVAIGSVAKTMTSYIILRDHPLKTGEEGPKIEIDATAEKEGGYNKDGESTLDTVKAGDFLTEKQALSAVMIPSANNIARLLARWDAGSEAAFVDKMNATAKELGMTDTHYTDPSGLKETTVSTAEDQVKLGRAVVKNPAMVAITSAASWTDPSGKYWTNNNELPYRIGAIGIKTGSTTAAGGNLLFASRKEVDGHTVNVVGAILGQHKPRILETANAVSRTALLAAEDALTSAKILKKDEVVGYVDDQLGGRTPVVVTRDVSAAGWAGLKVKLSLTSASVPHTAKAGTAVGTLTMGDGTSSAVRVPVALQENLTEPNFGTKLTRVG